MKQLKKHPKQQRMEEMTFPLHKEKNIWTGREYLRSINDDNGFTLLPRIVWRVVAVGVLVGAVIYVVHLLL